MYKHNLFKLFVIEFESSEVTGNTTGLGESSRVDEDSADLFVTSSRFGLENEDLSAGRESCVTLITSCHERRTEKFALEQLLAMVNGGRCQSLVAESALTFSVLRLYIRSHLGNWMVVF